MPSDERVDGHPHDAADDEPVDEMTSGELTLPRDGGTDDADAARRHAETIEEHTRRSGDPTDPAAPRPTPGSSSREANG